MIERARSVSVGMGLFAAIAVCQAWTPPASAQPAQPPAGGQPAQPAAGADKPEGTPKDDKLGPGDEAIKDKPDTLFLALAPQPGGLTFESVAKEAVATSTAVQVKEADIAGAEGQVATTLVQFFPRLTFAAGYTRLSEVDSGGIGGGFNVLGAANAGLVSVAPCPNDPNVQCVVDSGGLPVQAAAFNISFDAPLNQISFTANLSVPISDYFLRAVQAYNAAEANEKSLRLSADAQRLASALEAKLALLNWALAKGQVVVADRSVDQAKAQLTDAKAVRAADQASDGDVFRIEALVAQAEGLAAEARAQEFLAGQRVRTIIHAAADRQLSIGVDVFAIPGVPTMPNVDDLLAEALRNRLELQSMDEAKKALLEAQSATNAGFWPRLDGFADAVLANPNSRIFPQEEKFNFTWDVGLRLTWSVNDTFGTIGAAAQAKARTAALDAQRLALIDAIRLDVMGAHADLAKAQPSIEAAARGLVAAEETLRVTKKLFAFGRANATTLADAENSVTAARLRKLSAQVGLVAALLRLDHATGRDRGNTVMH
ncbi:MAG: TolC family protein [Polyangiaceae bacterium]